MISAPSSCLLNAWKRIVPSLPYYLESIIAFLRCVVNAHAIATDALAWCGVAVFDPEAVIVFRTIAKGTIACLEPSNRLGELVEVSPVRKDVGAWHGHDDVNGLERVAKGECV